MPIFSQRRLSSMMTELSKYLDDHKRDDILKRLKHTDTNASLAAEAELSVLWAISRVAHMAPEPRLPNSRHRPDAASDDLFFSRAAIIEVRALSDDSFSGKEAMDRTANIIASYADRLRKGAGKHLYFEFEERSYWASGYHRERCVDPSFKLSPRVIEQLQEWITAADWPNPECIRVTEGKTDVLIEWLATTVPLFRTRSRFPPVAYHRENNPVFKALKKKARQLRGAAEGVLRCVVLVDVGCNLLRNLRPMGSLHEVSGQAIIQHALAKLSIDVVIVLSPYRHWQLDFVPRSELLWNLTCFDIRKVVPEGEYDRVLKLAAQLPKPRYEGYEARDRHRLGTFVPGSRERYLPSYISTKNGGQMTIKLSAGLLHELLAGRIDAEQFRSEAFRDDPNYFQSEFARGTSIRHIEFQSGGVDEDDDYVIFSFDYDFDKFKRR